MFHIDAGFVKIFSLNHSNFPWLFTSCILSGLANQNSSTKRLQFRSFFFFFVRSNGFIENHICLAVVSIVQMMFLWFGLIRYFIRVFCLFSNSMLLLPPFARFSPQSLNFVEIHIYSSDGMEQIIYIYYRSKYTPLHIQTKTFTHRYELPNDTNQLYLISLSQVTGFFRIQYIYI